MDVKSERLNSLCHGCLSSDRKLNRMNEEFSNIFYKLRNDNLFDKLEELVLCWECYAFLKKLKSFQMKIKSAQCLLMQYLQALYTQDTNIKPKSLSQITRLHIDNYHYKFSYEEKNTNVESNQTDVEPRNNINDKQTELDEIKKVLLEEYTDIKIECNDNGIKEEYNSNDHDSEYYDTEFKFESDDTDKSVLKQKKNSTSEQRIDRKKYESLATITKRKDMFDNGIVDFYETVRVGFRQYDSIVKKRNKFPYDSMQFKCKDCSVGYMRKLDLLRHASFCHNKAPFPHKCKACTTMITSAVHLEEHWMNAHTAMLKCSLCHEICRSMGEIKKHLNKKHTKLFRCKQCATQFGMFHDFVKHYKSTHETVICDHCNMSFTKKSRLSAHMRQFHLPSYCDICKRSYSNYKTFRYHNRVTHPELLGAGETRAELSYCVECDKQYPSVYKYRRHLQHSPRHTPQKKIRVPCPDCGKVFTRTNFMKNHYRFAHLKVTKNYCDQCDKYYTTGYGLRKHIERVHKKIAQPKDKICDLCGRGFGTNKILINHRRTHTGERPHKCPYCPAAFAQETAMKTHQKTQHKNICVDIIAQTASLA